VKGDRARLWAGLAAFVVAWLPTHAAGAANSPTFRDCAFIGGLDPDFVRLSGATIGPGGMLTVTSSQPAVTLEASESSDAGDNLGQDSFTVTVTGTGGGSKTVSGTGVGHVTLTVPLAGVTAGGNYSLNWSAIFDNGFHHCPGSMDPQNPSANPFVLGVVAGPPPPAPVVTSLRESHRKWRESAKSAPSSHAPIGTKFSFGLSEPARVRLAFRALVHGHSVGRGALSVAGPAGRKSVRFDGKIPGRRRLAPGRYMVMITATDATGQRSAAKSIAFRIVG